MYGPILREGGRGAVDCPLYLDGRRVGTLRVAPAGEDTCFIAEGTVPPGLYRLWAVGGCGELALGLWEGREPLRRRFSRSLTAPAGPVKHGVARPVAPDGGWAGAPPERFPGWPVSDGLCRRRGRLWELALPFAPDGPFPLPALFCLAEVRRFSGRRWAVFPFDDGGRPVPLSKF
ncbi:MAG: hypothetical protein E7426_02580 [Ruminococcaceae bacterium]|nr:hypothetical protein [Oscillospiraceae bacterium]